MLNLNPKIQAGAVVSVALAVALVVAQAFGIEPNPHVSEVLAPFVPVIVGYLKKDTAAPAPAAVPAAKAPNA